MSAFETFRQLHYNDQPVLIGNVWDVPGAKAFERNGFKAIATSSAAVAYSMGYEDGENIPFSLLLETVKRIKDQITVPLSVDMEGGYSRTIPGIIQNIEKLHELGVVGINLEDSVMTEKGGLQRVEDFQKIISSIMDHLSRKNRKLFLNARTDAYLRKFSSPLPETITRAKAYEKAGASGIFVPFISDKEEIKKIAEATKLPLNVLCMPGLPSFRELADAGVKRISMGSSLYHSVVRSMDKTIQQVLKDQSSDPLFHPLSPPRRRT